MEGRFATSNKGREKKLIGVLLLTWDGQARPHLIWEEGEVDHAEGWKRCVVVEGKGSSLP